MSIFLLVLSVVLFFFLGIILIRNNYVNQLHKDSMNIAFNILEMISRDNVELSDEMLEVQASKLAGMIEVCLPTHQWLGEKEPLAIFVLGFDFEVEQLINGNPLIRELKHTITEIEDSMNFADESDNLGGVYVLEISRQQAGSLYDVLKKLPNPSKNIKKVLSKLKTIIYNK